MAQSGSQQPLFTCISCSIAFFSAEEQRTHYRSDFHRYNMKRRVASLPPVNAAAFNEKVLERRAETAIMASPKATSCDICNKAYGNENSYRSHLQSKKHKENELKALNKSDNFAIPNKSIETQVPDNAVSSVESTISLKSLSITEKEPTENEEENIEAAIDAKIAAARSRLTPSTCLFCSFQSSSVASNIAHMSAAHSFFIPDAEYLVSVSGLISYLGEKIAVGNFCIYCNSEFRSLIAVRNHMLDKSHCKIAYDTEKQRLEISDFYDFSRSYPDYVPQSSSGTANDEGEWEDVDEDDMDDVDEVVDVDADEDESDSGSNDTSDTESLPDNTLAYGSNHYELVLPSGARIGHRSQRKFHSLALSSIRSRDPKSLVDGNTQRMMIDKALVSAKGGFGAFGAGAQVVKARNRGEAREAGRHIREFRDQKRKEDYKTRVAFVHNNQKHFRDPNMP